LNRKLRSVIVESVVQFIAIDAILIVSIILLLNLFILTPLSTVNVMVGTVAEGNLTGGGKAPGRNVP
jgi:methyl-accepting chemotaxis protein